MKWLNYLTENIWVWAGTGLVLITLSGSTRTLGIWITALAISFHVVMTYLDGGSDE
jgi:hypothetical protein